MVGDPGQADAGGRRTMGLTLKALRARFTGGIQPETARASRRRRIGLSFGLDQRPACPRRAGRSASTSRTHVPFAHLKLHPSLLKGIKELGFARPTPIQADAIPPALAGRDVLACAMTGSGKTAAFLLPILHRLIDRPRGTTRALVLTPTRELAAQILEDLNDMAVHTPITAAVIIGGGGGGAAGPPLPPPRGV